MKCVTLAIFAALAAPGFAAAAPDLGLAPAPADALAASKLSRSVFAQPDAWARSKGDVQLPTALDSKLGSDRVVGAVGYLCGLGDHGVGPDAHGVRTSQDREDTFLGAQLRFSFR